MNAFSEVKKNFGFGCMRLPKTDNEVNLEEFSKMIKEFLDNGFNYFDTAHPYLGGKSELAIKECLTSKYDRSKYLLANKLSGWMTKTKEDVEPFFNKELDDCGVEYFDFYLLHSLDRNSFKHYEEIGAYEFIKRMKKEGKIHHIGFSFHDDHNTLENILNAWPEMEFVQLQINYLDWENRAVESKLNHNACEKHGKPVVVMEPVKGGALVNLTPKAQKIIDSIGGNYSNAGYAIRFAASLKQTFMVLSGMSDYDQMKDNVSTMKDFNPLTESERKTLFEVRDSLLKENMIPCTKCSYCVPGCPKGIAIPKLFNLYNEKNAYHNWGTEEEYKKQDAKAKDCIKCGKCERICPQHLPIRDLLTKISSIYDKE